MRKNKKLEVDDILFKVIKEEETCIKVDHKVLQIFLQKSQTPNLKVELPKEKKSLLIGLNVGNVAANIWLTRYVSTPMKSVTSVKRGYIFLTFMSATFL